MDVGLLEGMATATYERAGLDPGRPVSMFAIARRLYGQDVLVRARMASSPAATFFVNGVRKIALRRNLTAERSHFLVGHELGHALLDEEGYRENDIEAACDYLGAALLAPRPAMRQLRFAFGTDYEEIAGAVCATETWAALRVAEVTGTPTAVITPRYVRVRGDEWGWPESEYQLRQFARMPPLRGIRKASLYGDPRRVVLAVEDSLALGTA